VNASSIAAAAVLFHFWGEIALPVLAWRDYRDGTQTR